MTIRINDKILDYTIEQEKIIGEILGQIELACKKDKMTVGIVKIDGTELLSEQLDELFKKPIDSPIDIDLYTISGNEIREYIAELGKKLQEYAQILEEFPTKMNEGNNTEILSVLEKFSLDINQLYRYLCYCDITDIPSDYTIKEKSLSEYQEEISSLLKEMLSAFENNDTIHINDIAEYELAPLVQVLGEGLVNILNLEKE